MTSKEWLEKFHTDDVLLPMSSFGRIFILSFKIKNTFIVVFLFSVFKQDTFLRNPLLFFIYS